MAKAKVRRLRVCWACGVVTCLWLLGCATTRDPLVQEFSGVTEAESYRNPNVYLEIVREMIVQDTLIGMRNSEIVRLFKRREPGAECYGEDDQGNCVFAPLSPGAELRMVFDKGRISRAEIEYEEGAFSDLEGISAEQAEKEPQIWDKALREVKGRLIGLSEQDILTLLERVDAKPGRTTVDLLTNRLVFSLPSGRKFAVKLRRGVTVGAGIIEEPP